MVDQRVSGSRERQQSGKQSAAQTDFRTGPSILSFLAQEESKVLEQYYRRQISHHERRYEELHGRYRSLITENQTLKRQFSSLSAPVDNTPSNKLAVPNELPVSGWSPECDLDVTMKAAQTT